MCKLHKVSEKTMYEDGIRLYKYATRVLGFKKVIFLGFSEGVTVASNTAKYAENIGEGDKIKGIILASPMDGIESSVEKYTGSKTLGKLAANLLESDKPNTFENLNSLKNTSIPMLLMSGGEKEFLSLKLTHIDERLRKAGFINVYSYIKDSLDHTYNYFVPSIIDLKGDSLRINKDRMKYTNRSTGQDDKFFGADGKRILPD